MKSLHQMIGHLYSKPTALIVKDLSDRNYWIAEYKGEEIYQVGYKMNEEDALMEANKLFGILKVDDWEHDASMKRSADELNELNQDY